MSHYIIREKCHGGNAGDHGRTPVVREFQVRRDGRYVRDFLTLARAKEHVRGMIQDGDTLDVQRNELLTYMPPAKAQSEANVLRAMRD